MTNAPQPASFQPLILAAEDDNLTGVILSRMLNKFGYNLVMVSNGQQALDAFNEHQPDLVLLDAMMPKMDGFTACHHIKQLPEGIHTPVLIVTALQDKESIQKAFEAGASDYITKPVNWSVLQHRIEHLVQSHRAWQALQASEERFQQVIASITDHIYVTEITATGELINHYISPNVEKLSGYSLDSILEDWDLWTRLIHPEDQPVAKQQIESLLVCQSGEVEYRLETAAGKTIWVRDSARVERVNGKTFIYGVVSDITARKRAEESIRSSQKLAELGTLAAGVAHEINSPLQVITGVSEGLLKRHKEDRLTPDFLVRKLDVIQRNGWRCAEIVRSLKTYAYTAPAEMQAHNLNHIIKDTLLLTEHQLSSWGNITIQTQLADDLPPFFCDRNQITQILINLLTNASDALPDGGQISIGTRLNSVTDTVEMRVADNGHGIPPAIQTKIFDPFFTTKPVDKGTGLGLSIITGIIKAHGGTIALNSAPGNGSEFILQFPYSNKPAAAQISPDGLGRFDEPSGPSNPGSTVASADLITSEP